MKSKEKEEEKFNPAFHNLKAMIEKTHRLKRAKKISLNPKYSMIREDESYFMKAMSDVVPLSDNKPRHIKSPDLRIKPPHPPPDDVKEALEHLQSLVKGIVEMDITFSDEFMEGSLKSVNKKIMKRLKRGRIRYQDYLDLHGMTRREAEQKIKEFLISSHRRGIRCVLIIHGRGLNSPENYPVLKEMLPFWLNRGPVRKIVLAFATAQPYDGGPGAIYVLLRRR